jgi:hypothetical protein
MDQEDLKCLQGHFVLHEVALSVHWFVYVEARGRRLGEFPARTIRRVCGSCNIRDMEMVECNILFN